MSYLCYCVFKQPGPALPESLKGVGGRAVYQVGYRGLSAAVSMIARAEVAPDVARVRAYDRVVGTFHRHCTVIPLRYGCILDREPQVIQLLEQQGPHYESLLQELAGCVEMGLRVLLPAVALVPFPANGAAGREERGPDLAAPPSPPSRPGQAYLTARKAHYAHQDRWTGEYRRAAARYLDRFAGLYVKAKMESPTPRLPLLSLYFLVPRGQLGAFRQAFRRGSRTESARLLLSGPWPPYNFVNHHPLEDRELDGRGDGKEDE
jgi:hypothetical protein